MVYRKEDVEFHADYLQDRHAAVNVKSYDWLTADTIRRVLADEGYILATGTDIDELAEAIGEDTTAFEFAAQDGWEQAEVAAQEVFGRGYGVTSEGRSSGWCVVTYNGRATFDEDDVDGWDAIALGQWRKFAQWVRIIADDQAYRMAWTYIVNVLEPARADVASFALAGVGL